MELGLHAYIKTNRRDYMRQNFKIYIKMSFIIVLLAFVYKVYPKQSLITLQASDETHSMGHAHNYEYII